MAESKSTPPVWIEALRVSMVLLIPGFLLMIGGFFLWNPSLARYFLDKDKTKIENEVQLKITQEFKKQIQDETKKQIEVEKNSILAGQNALLELDKESPLGRTYVSREITIQAEEQAKKVAKEEISQAKGDLFGQITFPVIFAIASIFAAFAVKDILTEVLKKEEKTALRNEIIKTLREELGIPEDRGNSNEGERETVWSVANKKIDEIEKSKPQSVVQLEEKYNKRLGWIEYELASLSFYTESKTSKKILNQHMCRIEKAVKNLIELDKDEDVKIRFLESYDKAYFCAITSKRHETSSCNQSSYDKVDILLERAKLTLSEIEKNDEFKDVLEFLKDEVTRRNNITKAQAAEITYSNQQPDLTIAPKRASTDS